MKAETKYIGLGAAILILIGVILAFLPGNDAYTHDALNRLKIATGFTLLALIFLLGLAVLVYIANGTIDLSDLLSEPGGAKGASMSRFQLLIFTLVIGLSLFLVTVSNMAFPDHIPPEILTLLGISASTYAVSKGIQSSGGQTTTTTQTSDATVSTTTPANPAAAATVTTIGSPADPALQTTTTTLPDAGRSGA